MAGKNTTLRGKFYILSLKENPMKLVIPDWQTDHPGQWSLVLRIISILLLCSLTAGGYYLMVLEPLINELKQGQEEESRLKLTLTTRYLNLTPLDVLEQQAQQTHLKLTQARERLLHPADVPYFINEIARIARDSQLELVLAKTGEEIPRDFYNILSTELRFTGTYPAYLDFMQTLAQRPHLATLHELRISPKTPHGKVSDTMATPLVISAKLNTYIHKEDP